MTIVDRIVHVSMSKRQKNIGHPSPSELNFKSAPTYLRIHRIYTYLHHACLQLRWFLICKGLGHKGPRSVTRTEMSHDAKMVLVPTIRFDLLTVNLFCGVVVYEASGSGARVQLSVARLWHRSKQSQQSCVLLRARLSCIPLPTCARRSAF